MSTEQQPFEAAPKRGRPAQKLRRVPRLKLPSRQRRALDVIVQYYRATGEACPSTLIARQMEVHHSTIQDHLAALYRKGWLRTPNAPATPTRF